MMFLEKSESKCFKNPKKNLFHKFLALKIVNEAILHKKIVHKIYLKYSNLQSQIGLDWTDKHNQIFEEHKFLQQKISQFTSVQSLAIYTTNFPNFGLRYIGKGLYFLQNLKHLTISVDEDDHFDIQYYYDIPDYFYHILHSCEHLQQLQSFTVYIGDNLETENGELFLQYLPRTLKKLKKLQEFSIHIYNYQCNNESIIENLLMSLQHIKSLNIHIQYTSYRSSSITNSLQKGLPHLKTLENFIFDYNYFNLNYFKGFTFQDMTKLTSSLLSLSQLKSLTLNLSTDDLGSDTRNFQNLEQCFRKLNYISSLELDLSQNNITQNPENITNLANGLAHLAQLKTLKLNLANNNLWIDHKNIRQLMEALGKLNNLTNLNLNLSQNNYKGTNIEIIRYVKQGLKYLKNLEKLNLNLERNKLGSNNKDLLKLKTELQQKFEAKNLQIKFDFNSKNLFKQLYF